MLGTCHITFHNFTYFWVERDINLKENPKESFFLGWIEIAKGFYLISTKGCLLFKLELVSFVWIL